MKYKNKTLNNFIKISLKNNLDNTRTIKGKILVDLIKKMLKEEKETLIEELKNLLYEELDRTNHDSILKDWQGEKNIEDKIYEKIKEKILVELEDKINKIN